ncbi:MAG TPA: UvrD-helicase domain-containing protein, partial [Mariprofundaceae bacterium]|nr:UvrD-helicase domain-containing protein [Mariprofundaceae bacterium]
MSTEVRQQAINPAISCLVQAPAGSGKTELLTQRILALLAIVNEPEEILALTFTRKAAAEMRNRVVDALNMPEPDDELSHKWATWKLANRALARSEERGWNLADHPARLRIMTLDSLTGSLARQLPLLSGLGDIPTPTEHSSAIYRQAAERSLHTAMRDSLPAAELLLLHQDHNSVALIDLMVSMLGSRDQWLKYVAGYHQDTDQLKQIIESNLAEYLTFRIEACNRQIPIEVKASLTELIRFAGGILTDETLQAFDSWPQADAAHLQVWKTIAGFLLTASNAQFKKRLDKNSGFPPTAKAEKQQMQELLDILTPIPGLAESLHLLRSLPDSAEFEPRQWQVAESLFELLPKAVVELKSLFSSRGEADFTEIALRALDALIDADDTPTDLLLKLDYRINHILVDEFQDTSELQMRLMQCLTAGWQPDDGHTLFMVGDPMQSIYRFRKAEVGLFLQAAENRADLPPVTALQLERNFRSSPDIVGWVNRAFSKILPEKQDAISGAIAYANAESALEHQGSVTLHLQTATGDSGQVDENEAAAVVVLVREALGKKQRVGILARTRKHLHAIIPALHEAGIAHRAINILPLNTRPEIRGLRTLVRALLHPADHESWLALLRAPYCGLSTSELFTLLHGDERTIWEIIQDEEAVGRMEQNVMIRVQHLARALKPCMDMSSKLKLRELAT